MLNLSDTEEILAILIAVAIIMGFVFSTYKEIQSTIAEEKAKQREKKETEAKVKTLIKYLDAKTELIDAVNKVTKKEGKSSQ
jgi:Na+-transporting methylmalonyl-CoA/oxaloacetate decarboxylase gamma subunit